MALRPRFTTPFSRARDLALQYALKPFKVFKPGTQFLIGFGFLVVVTALLLLSNYSSGFSQDYREGEVIRGNVVARGDVSGIDIVETERRRNAARDATRPVFNFDSSRGESSARSFRAAWEELKNQAGSKTPGEALNWSGDGGAGAPDYVDKALAPKKSPRAGNAKKIIDVCDQCSLRDVFDLAL